MSSMTIHNPDRYMVDLRQILSQGRKRIGLLIGAGAPMAILVNGKPLIPDVARLTAAVVNSLNADDTKIIQILKAEIGGDPNIEAILTRVRRLAQVIGQAQVHAGHRTAYQHDILKNTVVLCGFMRLPGAKWLSLPPVSPTPRTAYQPHTNRIPTAYQPHTNMTFMRFYAVAR
jgi:hypothetical protein